MEATGVEGEEAEEEVTQLVVAVVVKEEEEEEAEDVIAQLDLLAALVDHQVSLRQLYASEPITTTT